MGQLIIPDNATVYVDTAPVIYSVETNPDYWALLQPLWTKSQASQIDIISSELLLLETFVFPLKNNNTELVAIYEELFTDDIQLLEITQRILRSAAQLRSVSNLKTPDAIHAATALDAGCTIFLTNDSGLRTVPGLSVIVLKDVLNA
jgi:predicted nucleic acid-binding protein